MIKILISILILILIYDRNSARKGEKDPNNAEVITTAIVAVSENTPIIE